MKTHRRRRKGFDEERKRELRKDLERYFTLSKHISLGDRDTSERDNNLSEQNPEAQLEQAQQFGHNFADTAIFPPSQSEKPESVDQIPSPEETSPEQKSPPEQEHQNETLYSKLGLEQLQEQEEARTQDLYAQKAQYLLDLPITLESVNQGHILQAFNEPFLVLEELLVMAQRENPELDALQRLWLVWGKWETYYVAWHSIVREDERQLPGKGRESWSDRHQERGIHELETAHLENTILRVMRREIAQKSAEEQEFIKTPTHHQLHCYFLGLRRQDWDATSWQRPTPNGANLLEEEEEELNGETSDEI